MVSCLYLLILSLYLSLQQPNVPYKVAINQGHHFSKRLLLDLNMLVQVRGIGMRGENQ